MDVENERKNITQDFIVKLRLLQSNGVDISNITQQDTIKTLAQKSGISEEQINAMGLDPYYRIGAVRTNITHAYRGNGTLIPPTDEQVKKLQELGISLEKKDVVQEFIKKIELMQSAGIDTNLIEEEDTIQSVAGKIGISADDIKGAGLDPEEKIGRSKHSISQLYEGKGTVPPTKEQVEKLVKLGIIDVEKETIRHKKKLRQIRNANTKEELPSASFSAITRFLANNTSFDGKKVSTTEFNPVLKALIDHNFFWVPEVKKTYLDVVATNFPDATKEEVEERFKKLATAPQIIHYLLEASERSAKIVEFRERDELEAHKQTMKQIKQAFELKDLPKVGVGTLNGKIMKATKNDFIPRFSIEQIRTISEMLLSGEYSEEDSQTKLLGEYSEEDIEQQIHTFCESYGLSPDDTELMYDQIIGGFFLDKTIGYTVGEIKEKEKRVLQIYKMDHDAVMDQIKDAKRISQMPKDLTESVITAYLCGNSTIYPSGDRISTTDFKEVTDLLLQGEDFNSYKVEEALRTVAAKYYPEKTEEALGLLKDKLGKLPRTQYLVEEVNASNEKQAKLIDRRSSNVNLYLIPNPKSPMEGGAFYNVYKNSASNLDLSAILPANLLDIDEIVPKGLDVDSIEWYVQEKIDPTFKLIGGVITYKDESIGNVNVFRPSGGPVGITPEENAKRIKLLKIGEEVQNLIAAKEAGEQKFKELMEGYKSYQGEIDGRLAALKEQMQDIVEIEPGDEKGDDTAAQQEQ